MVRISFLRDFGNSHHSGSLAVGMVKEHEVALPHLPHVISSLIVPYAFPVVSRVWFRLQVF
jgi:hypothetical protein